MKVKLLCNNVRFDNLVHNCFKKGKIYEAEWDGQYYWFKSDQGGEWKKKKLTGGIYEFQIVGVEHD